jgi:hypothetical protein
LRRFLGFVPVRAETIVTSYGINIGRTGSQGEHPAKHRHPERLFPSAWELLRECREADPGQSRFRSVTDFPVDLKPEYPV